MKASVWLFLAACVTPVSHEEENETAAATATTESELQVAAFEGESHERAAMYFQMRCAGCHGAEGRGDGVMAPMHEIFPRDMGSAEFQDGMSDSRMRAFLTEGKKNHLSVSDLNARPHLLNALVAHIRGFADRKPAQTVAQVEP